MDTNRGCPWNVSSIDGLPDRRLNLVRFLSTATFRCSIPTGRNLRGTAANKSMGFRASVGVAGGMFQRVAGGMFQRVDFDFD